MASVSAKLTSLVVTTGILLAGLLFAVDRIMLIFVAFFLAAGDAFILWPGAVARSFNATAFMRTSPKYVTQREVIPGGWGLVMIGGLLVMLSRFGILS